MFRWPMPPDCRSAKPPKSAAACFPTSVFEGEVTRITGEADLQRNTSQAKVRITDPIDQLRPEMLCRVEFLGNSSAAGTASDRIASHVDARSRR